MICLSIGANGASNVSKALSKAQMAEIRLDLTNLNREETISLFESKKDLVATCRIDTLPHEESKKRLHWAILGSASKRALGQRYIDLDYDAPDNYRKELIGAAKQAGFRIILSFHNYESTDSFQQLSEIYETARERGADIVKIVTTVRNIEESARIVNLYKKYPPDTLLAFALNKEGRMTRILSATLGAPFIYCSLDEGEKTAEGQYSITEAKRLLSKKGYPVLASRTSCVKSATAPASKSHAQRAILSAAWAKGVSTLYGYTACADSEAALSVIRSLGVKVARPSDQSLQIESPGIDQLAKNLPKQKIYNSANKNIRIDVGESGLLCRLMIPLSGQLIRKSNDLDSVTITGKGSLLKRALFANEKPLNHIGLQVETIKGKLPATIRGTIKGAHVLTSGKDGSQLLSGMLMALPLCPEHSCIKLTEPKSIPYIDLTIKTLEQFGISIGNKDFERFEIPGKQAYTPTPLLPVEGDWSGASMLLVAGAISTGITVTNLPIHSQQSDKKILDILTTCGVDVHVDLPLSKIVIAKPDKPLIPFETDATHFPDLFPSLVVLALNCNGTSRIKGLHRLFNKESNRAESLFCEFTKLGAIIEIDDDCMIVTGGGLHGGWCASHNDHRIAMALITASLKIKGKVYVDDLYCISKSFPDFIKNFR